MNANPIDVFMDVIEGAPLDRRQTQFATAVLTLLAMRLRTLTPEGRHRFLQQLADEGALLRLSKRLCCESSLSPTVPYGTRH